MTHLQLIELIYKFKDTLKRAYTDKSLQNAPQELVDSTIFIKLSNRFILNKNYIKFVDSVLDRVDYSLIFEDYEKEHKELIKYFNRYKTDKKSFYKDKILKYIDDIYLKFFFRDKEINQKIKRFEQEATLEIKLIIEEARDLLEQISQLIDANNKIIKTFSELKKYEEDFREKIVPLDENFGVFVENIDGYITYLTRFIVQTETKRKQNKLFLKISNDILNEDDSYLNEQLELNIKVLFHTIKYTARNKIKYFIEDSNRLLKRELKELRLIRPAKKIVETILKEQKKEELNLLDIDEILGDLDKTGSEDLFVYLLRHKSINNDISMAFKIYLQLLSYTNVKFRSNFNDYNIKMVRWENV